MKERNILQREWDTYLKKYANEYRITIKEDGHNAILCKNGEISRYSNTELVYFGCFDTIRQKNARIKLMPSYCEVTQEGDTEVCIKFPEHKLKELIKPCVIRKKKQLSEEHKQLLRNRLIELKKAQ